MQAPTQEQIEEEIQAGFAMLPESVQQAIMDASVEKKLRGLAGKHKLLLDKWVVLENAIMFTLIGLERPEDMPKNIAHALNMKEDAAQALVNDIAREVFDPIRALLEKELEEGRGEKRASRETVFVQEAKKAANPTLASTPADTQTLANQGVKVAPSDSTTYKAGESSLERRDVQGDPYRESIG